MHEDQMYRKHLRPGAYSISPLAKGNHMHAEAIREATKMHAELDAMPLNPSSKFAVISAHEFANFADSSPGVPAVKDFHGHDKPKKEMQDRHTIIDPWGPREDMAFLGVYDGHAGSVAAEYCRNTLHDILLEELGLSERPTDLDFAKAFTRTFERVDANLRSMGVSCGTTATVAVLHHPDPTKPAKVHVANVGDSPAVLFGGTFENPIAARVFEDHNAGDEKERMRVRAAGGEVGKTRNNTDVVRVVPPGSAFVHTLQCTRSLGDFLFKDPTVYSSPVTPTPHVCSRTLEGWEIGLMMMSDGVCPHGFETETLLVKQTFLEFSSIMERNWAVRDGKRVTTAGPAEHFAELQERSELARRVIEEGYDRSGTTDNMTLVVAFFRSFCGGSSPKRRASHDDSLGERDPDHVLLPFNMGNTQEKHNMWDRCVIQNDFKTSTQGCEQVAGDYTYLATGNFLKVQVGVYEKGPRIGQKVVRKRFLKDKHQRDLKEDAEVREVYENDDWKCEVDASLKAAEIVTQFNLEMHADDSPGLVTINLPAIWRRGNPDKTGKHPHRLIEPFIEGEYTKFNSNSGWTPPEDSRFSKNDIMDYMQALSHFSWDWSGGENLLCDLQGAYEDGKYVLTDPAIHSKKVGTYGDTDCGIVGQQAFFRHHKCSHWCQRRPDGSERIPRWKTPSVLPPKKGMPVSEHTSRFWDVPGLCQ
eukprot:TRINITY_DN1138_c0_g1_i2.p1 TRINITY_DN1138_c0_g1~~TRINITY_DN1138_c0_g1_i2.p1  ORF type:complete len:699 (-),score=80.89 TRINITY_DN1138_c0_g1_i2:283-2379(-)